jgi:hypothetical protein
MKDKTLEATLSMASRKVSGTLTTLTISLALAMLAGCNWFGSGSGSGSPTPTPQPTPQTQASSRMLDVHTVLSGKQDPSGLDGDHCFQREDDKDPNKKPLDVLVTVQAPEITAGAPVVVRLINLSDGSIVPPKTPQSGNPVQVTYGDALHDELRKGNSVRKTRNGDNRQHLGPGPYAVTAQIGTAMVDAKLRDGKKLQPVVLTFPYVTYQADPSECPVWGAQVSAHP